MKNKDIGQIFISLVALVFLVVSLSDFCKTRAKLNYLFEVEVTIDTLRKQQVPLEIYDLFIKWEIKEKYSCYDYLGAYFITGETEKEKLESCIDILKQYRTQDFQTYTDYLCAIWKDLEYFPIPLSTINQSVGVSFSDSWMMERTFGGVRGHEGTDIMTDINQRGYYPVVSMTDGVVEKIGWLTQGGYRLGIRAPHGGYFYYAHLYDYAQEFQQGDTVKAGELIGFVGDSGYSEIEGTVGNFDVHLHLGIYVNQPDGTEISVNSFYPLKYLESKKLEYIF